MAAQIVEPNVRPWSGQEPPAETEIRRLYEAEGLQPYRWGNGPGDIYDAHSHPYHKVIYVVRGAITFGLPARGEQFRLHAGDRLDLPAGTIHDAVVGPEGVVCLEAHRPA
jgi:quercetin dioxygenase-like cupin family protein